MTTEVIVRANHGWPVEVTRKDPKTGEVLAPAETVAPNSERIYHVHSSMDLHIHEVQPVAEPVPDEGQT